MRYAEAIQFLYNLQLFGLKLGLENTRQLARLAGNPHRRLRFVHVAGTNGKGSTCALLESMYRAAGLRVGLFTSPHLVNFGERIQVDRRPISESDIIALTQQMQEWVRAFPAPGTPTFFEVVTVMAMQHFLAQECDVVIWETGMGGRLDATNIVTPLASVITNIQFDHEKWLGHTLAEISTEKAGIIKPAVPVLTAAEAPIALEVIRQTARTHASPLIEVTRADTSLSPLDRIDLPLLGEHQRLNAALAVRTVTQLQPDLPVPASAIEHGLREVRWAGRLQVLREASGQINLLDGAHNPAGVATLRSALANHFHGRRPTLIFGVLADKDWHAMCRQLAPVVGDVVLVPVSSPRSTDPLELIPLFADQPHPPLTCASLAEALQRTQDHPFRLITGSLYLIGQALELLGGWQARPTHERALNEWQPMAPARA